MSGYIPRGRGGFNNNNNSRGGGRGRGGRGRGGRGRGGGGGGFQQKQHYNPYKHVDVDYSPEAIEQRFSPFYLPSMTQDPWQQLIIQQK